MNYQQQYLTRREAAEYLSNRGLKTAEKTLGKLACVGGGPRYSRYGKIAVYTIEDLNTWTAQRLGAARHNTSEAA